MEADWAALNAKSEKREASRCLHGPGTKSNVGAPGEKSISRLTELSSGSLGCSELSRLAGKPSRSSASLGPVHGAQGLQALWATVGNNSGKSGCGTGLPQLCHSWGTASACTAPASPLGHWVKKLACLSLRCSWRHRRSLPLWLHPGAGQRVRPLDTHRDTGKVVDVDGAVEAVWAGTQGQRSSHCPLAVVGLR